jgi:carboxypeptidase Q
MVSAFAEETSLLMTLVTMLAAPPYSADAAARIVGGALADGNAYARLAELTDGIGPRLSGSPGAEAAVAWAVRKFQEDGVAARTEPVKAPHWIRGEESAAIVASPAIARHALGVSPLGGGPPPPPARIEAEFVEVGSLAEIARLGDKVRARIVFFDHDMSTAKGYGEFASLRTKGPADAAKACPTSIRRTSSARSVDASGRRRSSSSAPTSIPGTSPPAPWTTARTARWCSRRRASSRARSRAAPSARCSS